MGVMSLKSTLSVLSMAGAMALFASIEQSLQHNGDAEGLEWLRKEKEAYLKEISLMEPGWFSKPWTISGSIICVLILFSSSSLGICHCRNKRRSTQERQEEERLEEEVRRRHGEAGDD